MAFEKRFLAQEDIAKNKDEKRGVGEAKIIVSRSHPGPVKANLEVLSQQKYNSKLIFYSLQGALGTGISITNAGGAGFKAWEVVKVSRGTLLGPKLLNQ